MFWPTAGNTVSRVVFFKIQVEENANKRIFMRLCEDNKSQKPMKAKTIQYLLLFYLLILRMIMSKCISHLLQDVGTSDVGNVKADVIELTGDVLLGR